MEVFLPPAGLNVYSNSFICRIFKIAYSGQCLLLKPVNSQALQSKIHLWRKANIRVDRWSQYQLFFHRNCFHPGQWVYLTNLSCKHPNDHLVAVTRFRYPWLCPYLVATFAFQASFVSFNVSGIGIQLFLQSTSSPQVKMVIRTGIRDCNPGSSRCCC